VTKETIASLVDTVALRPLKVDPLGLPRKSFKGGVCALDRCRSLRLTFPPRNSPLSRLRRGGTIECAILFGAVGVVTASVGQDRGDNIHGGEGIPKGMSSGVSNSEPKRTMRMRAQTPLVGTGVKPRRVGEVSEGIFRGEYSL